MVIKSTSSPKLTVDDLKHYGHQLTRQPSQVVHDSQYLENRKSKVGAERAARISENRR